MIYFGYPLDIHGWKPKSETEPETKPKPESENRGRKTNTKSETRKTETRGYPHRTRSAAIPNCVVPSVRRNGLHPFFTFLGVELSRIAIRNDRVSLHHPKKE